MFLLSLKIIVFIIYFVSLFVVVEFLVLKNCKGIPYIFFIILFGSSYWKEGRLFVLMTHSPHFVYSYNLYGVRHIVKDHSHSERKPSAATTRATFF